MPFVNVFRYINVSFLVFINIETIKKNEDNKAMKPYSTFLVMAFLITIAIA